MFRKSLKEKSWIYLDKKKARQIPGFFEFGLELHSHTFDTNIDLFENFIENFIEIEVKLKRTSKDDFIELH